MIHGFIDELQKCASSSVPFGKVLAKNAFKKGFKLATRPAIQVNKKVLQTPAKKAYRQTLGIESGQKLKGQGATGEYTNNIIPGSQLD